MRTGLLSLLLVAANIVQAGPWPSSNLLANGAFAAPLDSGWTRNFVNHAGSHAFRPLKDGGIKVTKTQCGTATLSQDVILPDTRFVFTTRAMLAAEANRANYNSFAAVVLGYQDKDGKSLGETRIIFTANAAAPPNTPTRHVIMVAKANSWTDYAINLTDELRTNLKGIVPARVRRLRISYEAYGSGTGAC